VATRRRVTGLAGLAGPLLLGIAALAAGCAGPPAPRPAEAAAGTSCGTVRTGADVPAAVRVTRGRVDCATALRVEERYAAAIRAGGVRGNGGGAPVTVDGWTCRAYPTPQALRTGAASECQTVSAEVVAVLPSSSQARD
jgi:hypothetical protein